MDIYHLCLYRLVYGGFLRCIRPWNFRKPWILNGPYCPIYGCGVVIVVAVLTPLKDNLLILFIGSFLLTSILEYITGYLLEKVFHNQWWDYSDKPFNIHGYVCLKFSIYWGLACTFIMDVLHPIIYRGITLMPHIVGMILICIIMTVFFVDCGIP